MDAFEERLSKLNPEQKLAVETMDGPVMVIAGPGTGKTEILTMRIANILKSEKAKPDQILALTFTESGAVAMRRRLASLVGQAAYRVRISTFHGFANGVIGDYPEHFPDVIGASSITEIDQVKILRNVIDKENLSELRPFGDRYYYLTKILSSINELKRQGVSPKAFAEIIARDRMDFDKIDDLIWEKGAHKGKMKGKYADRLKHIERNAELATVYAAYQKALKAAKQYDYSDMIMQVMAALETNGDLLQSLQERFQYFLVDEHQDTNDAQNKIIELLVGGGEETKTGSTGPNLFVVGDEKQAIFRFQGASLENFLYFRAQFPSVKLIRLVNNYRSTQAILNAAEAISPRESKLAAKAGHDEFPAEIAALPSADIEYYFVARRIKTLIQKGVDAAEIAVLYRDNRDAAPLARILEKEGVPFAMESDQDVLGDDDIQKLLKILRAVEHFGQDPKLFEAMHVDFLNIPPIDIYTLSVFAKRNSRKMYDVLRSRALLDQASVESAEACLRLYANLQNWKRYVDNRPALDAFEAIVRESGFLASLIDHPSATEKIGKLHAFYDLLKSLSERDRNYRLGGFFAYIDLMIEHDVALKSNAAVQLPGRIHLMTAHRSKGLEFEYVIIVNAAAGKWGARTRREHIKLPKGIYRTTEKTGSTGPRLRKDDRGEDADEDEEIDTDDDADERNVFYVALTRAKKQVLITYAFRNRDGREQLATPFVTEFPPGILKLVDTTAIEQEFAAHPEIEFAPAPVRIPELKDKEFVNQLFETQGISVTALNNYLECPWQYFYRNLVRIPEAPNKHLCFGNAVHGALKSYFDVLSGGEDPGKSYLVQRFEECLAETPLAEFEYEEALQKGRTALAAYYDHYKGTWNPRTATERRMEGIKIDDIPVNGMIDKIEFEDGADNRVSVVDYKTGEPKSRASVEGTIKSSNGNYKRQLVFYKLLLDRQGEYSMQSGAIEFIEPDAKGKFHREAFVIDPAEITAIEDVIRTVAAEIRSLAFWNRTCERKDCEFCPIRRAMK